MSAVKLSEEFPVNSLVPINIVDMRRRHLSDVMAIDAATAIKPWSPSLFSTELATRDTRRYTVALVNKEVVGFCGLMYLPDEAHITTVAVHPDWQGQKIATRLVIDAAEEAIKVDKKHMALEVRVSNKTAQRLYTQFGFAPTGVRKNYYPDNHEDALVMWLSDIDRPEFSERLQLIRERLNGK